MFHPAAHKDVLHPAGQCSHPLPSKRHCEFRDHGNVIILYPNTPESKAWCEEHLPDDCARWGRGYVIEFRFVADIIDGLDDAGLL